VFFKKCKSGYENMMCIARRKFMWLKSSIFLFKVHAFQLYFSCIWHCDFAKVTAVVGSCGRWIRLVAANPKIFVKVQSFGF